jgi:RimJ/RimL family protein N-acetyltransferase
MNTTECCFLHASAEDAAAISEMALGIWRQHYWPEVLTQAEIDFFFERSYKPSTLVESMASGAVYEWIVKNDRRIGFLSYEPRPQADRMRLGKLYVAPEFHGQGYGAAALARIREAAMRLGRSEVELYVFRRNKKAIKAYQRAGFVIDRADCFDAGGGFVYDDYIMVLRL